MRPSGMQVVIPTCIPDGHLYRVTYTRFRIDTINSPVDGHMTARNMQRIEINISEKLCIKLVYLQRLQQDARSTIHKILHVKLIRSKVNHNVRHHKKSEEISGSINGEKFTNHLSYYRLFTTVPALLSCKLNSIKMIRFPRW